MTKSVRLHISGRVQGVWYRGWAVEKASMLGLAGWVRNRLDGTVEILLHGPRDKVDAMIEECRKGPPAASVSAITVEPVESYNGMGFTQRPTE
jgi:acylphosphatase